MKRIVMLMILSVVLAGACAPPGKPPLKPGHLPVPRPPKLIVP